MKLETHDHGLGSESQGPMAASEGLPKRRSDLSTRSTEGERLILDRKGGVIHQLNATASLIWDFCDGHTAIEEIVARIVEVFDVDRKLAGDDVKRTLIEFGSLHLLEKCES